MTIPLRRALAVCALALSSLLFGAHPAAACGCHDGGPVCEAFWKTPVVFAGRVTSIVKVEGRGRSDAHERVRFQVLEAFRGTTANEIELVNHYTSCQFAMPVGSEWLIYAFHRDVGGLSTSTCSRSRRLAKAQEDLAYIREARGSQDSRGRIFGQVFYQTNGQAGSRGLEPVPGARLLVKGPGDESVRAVTDANGRYEVRVPAGQYLVSAALPRGMSIPYGAPVAELPDARGCAKVDVWTEYPGSVTGKVLTADGRPVPNLPVYLLTPDARDSPHSSPSALTDAAGRFVMRGVVPGRYVAAVPVAYGEFDSSHDGIDTRFAFAARAPTKSRARALDVKGGAVREAGALALPKDIRVVQVTGVAVHADGRPAAGISVRTKADFDAWGLPWTTIRTDDGGRFTFALPAGTRYRLVAAIVDPGAPSSREVARITVDPTPAMPQLKLIIR